MVPDVWLTGSLVFALIHLFHGKHKVYWTNITEQQICDLFESLILNIHDYFNMFRNDRTSKLPTSYKSAKNL